MNGLSIIICTYNRPKFLKECINAVLSNTIGGLPFEILIINNLPSQIISFESSKVRIISEPEVGLSHARNRGANEAKYEWLFYLDDDAKVRKDTLLEIRGTIEENKYDLFTGVWKAWYLSPPPKWLPQSTGNYILKGEEGVRPIGNDYVSGGVMIIYKNKLIEIGGFPTNLGMTGNQIAYGEESKVEKDFKDRGYSVGINTNIIIDHAVDKKKYQLTWHLNHAIAKGVANSKLHKNTSTTSIALQLVKVVFFNWIKPLGKCISRKEYYYQNLIIDYAGSIAYQIGRLRGLGQ